MEAAHHRKREEKKKSGNTGISNPVSEKDNKAAEFRKKNTLRPPTVLKHQVERERESAGLYCITSSLQLSDFEQNVACSAGRAATSLCMKPSGEAPQIPYQLSQHTKERKHYPSVQRRNTNPHIYLFLCPPARLSGGLQRQTRVHFVVLIFPCYSPPGSPSQAIDAFGFTAHRSHVFSPFVLASFLLAYDRRTG